MFTGHVEPWDAEGWYYAGALFAAGFIATLFLPRAFWVAPIGVCAGQLVYGLYLEGTAFGPLEIMFAIVYGIAALAGALAGATVMWIISVLARIVRWITGRRAEVPG